MSDTIGRIVVPAIPSSGQSIGTLTSTCPITPDYPFGFSKDWDLIEHRFQTGATLAVQRFTTGFGARRFTFRKEVLSITDRAHLLTLFNAVQGSYQTLVYNAPSPGTSATTPVTVMFETAPLSVQHLASMCKTGFTFVEIIDPASAPSYSINATCLRFPTPTLASNLLSEAQQIIPLIHIKVRDPAVPDIYLSDRRVTVGGQLYLPRVLNLGEPGSDTIMSQDISGRADNVSFTFGNADRAMSALVKDTGLKFASIDLCLFRVDSPTTGTLLQLWKGIILSWTLDGSPNFKVTCSDGLFPIMQAYPTRVITRQCWKTFNVGACPFSSQGYLTVPTASPVSCDYFFNSPNGCLAHGMSPYFGAHPDFPQSVTIKDDGTGIVGGFFRSVVTSTSIVSDSIWGNALPEIWCNDDGDPQRAFYANCIVAAVRDESTFEDVLGIVGVGPIGAYEGMSVQTNSDGYQFTVAPLADGFPPQGFSVNTQLQVTGYHPGQGLREVRGTDPANLVGGTVNVNDLTVTYVSGTNFSGSTIFSTGTILYLSGIGYVTVFGVSSSTVLILVPVIVGITPTGYGVHSGVSWSVATDTFSLGQGTPQHWDVPDATFSNIQTGQANDILPFAAGTAFVELRYQKSAGSGITPTTTESHSMTVPVARGLTGYTYDPSGSTQTAVSGLTNPFWVAANCYWRALGIQPTDVSRQLASIILSSIVNTDGVSGCAQIADLLVTPVVGTTTPEIQFRAQGTISELKPFRDWLIEILKCALGYFTFEFGALKLGIRSNASATASFGSGNMLYQSLSVAPTDAAFEDLTIDYADRDLQYQQNTAEYQDKDHAAYYGRQGNPLATHIRHPFISTLSQGLRVAVTRVREEIGGILRPDLGSSLQYTEFDNANAVTFKTTILALDTEAGQVIEVTHPDLPTYPGPVGGSPLASGTWKFRIQKWTLHKDWSITIAARSVTDSMYDLDVGPKPMDVPANAAPVLFYPIPLGVWAPWQVQAASTDALYPGVGGVGEFTFSLSQLYTQLTDGTASASATVTGHLPVTAFIPGCGAPNVTAGKVTVSSTGGTILGGTTLRISLCAVDSSQRYSPPSSVLVVQIPSGTNTNSVSISGIQWPNSSVLTGWSLFAAYQDDLICQQISGSLTPVTSTTYSPTSLSMTLTPSRSTWGLPNPAITTVRLKYKLLLHGGVLGAAVDSAYGSTIVSNECVDAAATDNWAGRVLVIIGRNNTEAPFSAYNIIAFAPSTGTFTLDRAVTGVLPGDAFVVTFKGYDNSATPYVFTDAGISNAANVTQVGTAATNVGVLFSVPSNGATTTIAGKTYTFETTLTNVDGNVLIGASIAATLVNLMAAVNLGSGAGSLYAASMSANPNCTVTATLSPSISFVANLPGSAGNSLTCLGTLGYPVGGLFSGGEDAGSPAPHTGLSVNFESGLVGRIIAGFNRGAKANVVSNTATSYTFDSPMLMDTTSVLIIEAATWYPSVDTVVPANLDPTVTFTLPLPVINYEKTTLWVEGVTVDNNSVESSDGDACGRMLYLYGNGGERPDFGTALVTTTSTQV